MKEQCTAIVLAAGQGRRMGSRVQKQFLELCGYPVVYHSLKCFQECEWIDQIILVTGAECLDYCKREIVERFQLTKVKEIVEGGKERHDSVYAGLGACQGTDYVFVHDGARPLVSQEILERALAGVQECKACVVGMPSKDTVKLADDQGFVAETPSRDRVWNIQTPQAFAYEVLREAHDRIRQRDFSQVTDDAMVVEQETGYRVKLVEGSYENLKITTPEDLEIAKTILKKREMQQMKAK